MDLAGLRAVIGGAALPDVDACRRELEHVRCGRGLLDAREMVVFGRLGELTVEMPSIFPEDEVAKAAKSSLGKASRVRSRKQACDDIVELGDALANGDTTGERVDTFGTRSKPCSTTQPLMTPPPTRPNATTISPPSPLSRSSKAKPADRVWRM